MFAIVMTSIIDLALQNPVTNSGADNPVMRYLPSYGAMQASTAAGFSTSPVPRYLAIQLTWFAGRPSSPWGLPPQHPQRPAHNNPGP